MTQLSLFGEPTAPMQSASVLPSGTFANNLKLPVHRWFRYSAGFSAQWAEHVIRDHASGKPLRVLDPFCGSGTTLVAAAAVGAEAVGIEAHPFVYRVAKIKTDWNVDLDELQMVASRVQRKARRLRPDTAKAASPLLVKCYDPDNLRALESLKLAYEQEVSGGRVSSSILELIWLGITCILRPCSSVGTAQWQYILPKKRKARVKHPYAAFAEQMNLFVNDLRFAASQLKGSPSIVCGDARNVPDCSPFDLVVTSPPYPNNYDYADAVRLEMTFWQEVSSWRELHHLVRKYLIRSCSQHAAADRLDLGVLLENDSIDSIGGELTEVCTQLERVRLTKGGRKTYHTMVAAYFIDLAYVWRALRACTREGAQVAFVVGDSAPYGVYVPCDRWLGELAVAAGFRSWRFDKVRDRNVKWRNRKHRVPLKEGGALGRRLKYGNESSA